MATTFHTDKCGLSNYQVSEIWYGDEVQRQYLSSVHIDSNIAKHYDCANIKDPDENISEAIIWLQLPGTNGRYHFSLERNTVTV